MTTKDEVQAILPVQSEYAGEWDHFHKQNEWDYPHKWNLDLGKAQIQITLEASTVDIQLMSKMGKPITYHIKNKTSLLTDGWKVDVADMIQMYLSMYKQAGTCRVCGMPLVYNVANTAANSGKVFAKCPAHGQFTWIDKNKRILPEEYFAEKISSPVKTSTPVKVVGTLDLSKSNQFQKKFVTEADGYTVLDAGAGSGKTKSMVDRVMYLLTVKRVPPNRILVVTFSNKAAAEMRERLARMLFGSSITEEEVQFLKNPRKRPLINEDDPLADLGDDFSREWIEADPLRAFLVDWVCTIHAMSLRILKRLGMNYRVLDKDRDSFQIIKDALDEYKWCISPKDILWMIDYAIEHGIDNRSEAQRLYEDYLYSYDDIRPDASDILAEIFSRYMSYLKKHNLLNFTMMQSNLEKLIRTNDAVMEQVSEMFDYVIVDEGQDTDTTQFNILKTLTSKSGNFSIIGDVWQSMYRFRRAIPELMENIFDKEFPVNKRLTLPINYRSTGSIVKQSFELIKNNYVGREQYLKDVMPKPEAEEGDPVDYFQFSNFRELTDFCVGMVLDSGEPGKWFIVSRTRAECGAIHLGFVAAGVPATNLAGGNILGSKHIKQALAYARLAINYEGARDDMDIVGLVANVASDKFMSPVNRRKHRDSCEYKDKPWKDCGCPIIVEEGADHSAVRYYGKESVRKARDWNGIIYQRSERTNKGRDLSMAAKGAADLVMFVDELEMLSHSASECLHAIVDRSVLPHLMHEEGISEDDLSESSVVEDFDLLFSMCEDEMTMEQYLDAIDKLNVPDDGNDNSVIISTIHKVKGLEREYVIFNSTRCPIKPPRRKEGQLPVGYPTGISDERNMAYVAVTRAKECCYIVGSSQWMGQRMDVSPFIYELGIRLDQEEKGEEE